MRVALCDDSALFRHGLALLLADSGVEVVAQARDATELHTLVAQTNPDAVILDIRMPPTFTDEGLVAAGQLRSQHPHIGVLVLSTYDETAYASRLVAIGPGGVGYLLKDRVDDADTLRDALTRVANGQTVIDPEVIGRLLVRQRRPDPIDKLTARERDVLGLMAEGHSNSAIARRLHLGEKTVEGHIAALFGKLGLDPAPEANRRVLAVLTWLRSGGRSTS
jgi:DNA-binding NarL/FixJ family response regulator